MHVIQEYLLVTGLHVDITHCQKSDILFVFYTCSHMKYK